MLFSATVIAQSGLNLDGFYSAFNNYKYQNCIEYMDAFSEQSQGKDRLIWLLNNGVANSYAGNFERSNEYFTQAQDYFNQIKINMGNEALSYMLNPTKREYRGEDVEQLMIHYFKVYNYLNLNDNASALSELNQMEQILNGLLAEGMEKDNGLHKIGLIYLLKGLIYDADGNAENAYTNYYQAYEIYKSNYSGSLQIPEQLKKDLVRTAALTNATNYLALFKSEFGITPDQVKDAGNMVVFWNNGLGPVKEQSVLNFSLSTQGGGIRFTNQVTGETFPAAATAVAGAATLLSKGGSVTMAYPYYKQRPEVYTQGQLVFENSSAKLEPFEDINSLALNSLQSRKNKEMSEMLTRFAVKQLGKAGAKKLLGKGLDQIGLGSLKSLADKGVDAAAKATEKADLRYWGTLPNSIYYTRLTVPAGIQTFEFVASGNGIPDKKVSKDIAIEPSKTQFLWFNTPEHREPSAMPSNYMASATTPAVSSSNSYGLQANANNNSNYNATAFTTPSGFSSSTLSADLSQPLPELSFKEYSQHLKQKKLFYNQVTGNPKELKNGFQMVGKEYLVENYYIQENQIAPVEDKIYLEVKFNTKVREKIMGIKNLSANIEQLIWADLKSSLYPNLTKNAAEADYKLVVDVNKVVAKNNHFILVISGVIPAYIGFPSGFPKFAIQYSANLYTSNNQLVGSTEGFGSKQRVMFGLYSFSRQIGRPRYKNNPIKLNPMEEVMRDVLGKTKTDLYRLHQTNLSNNQ